MNRLSPDRGKAPWASVRPGGSVRQRPTRPGARRPCPAPHPRCSPTPPSGAKRRTFSPTSVERCTSRCANARPRRRPATAAATRTSGARRSPRSSGCDATSCPAYAAPCLRAEPRQGHGKRPAGSAGRRGPRRPELPCAASALGKPEPRSRIMVCHNVVTHSKTPVPHSCPTFRTGFTGLYNPVISQISRRLIGGESRTGRKHSQSVLIAKGLGYRNFRSYLPGEPVTRP